MLGGYWLGTLSISLFPCDVFVMYWPRTPPLAPSDYNSVRTFLTLRLPSTPMPTLLPCFLSQCVGSSWVRHLSVRHLISPFYYLTLNKKTGTTFSNFPSGLFWYHQLPPVALSMLETSCNCLRWRGSQLCPLQFPWLNPSIVQEVLLLLSFSDVPATTQFYADVIIKKRFLHGLKLNIG